MKKSFYTLFFAFIVAVMVSSCTGESSEDTDTKKSDIPAEKEIKLEDVSNQVKTDQEKYDSAKRALGIE